MAGRVVSSRFWVDWDFNGEFTNESSNVISLAGDMRLTPPGAGMVSAQGMIAEMEIELRNVSGRFSPLRTDGALYAFIRDGQAYHAPCYAEVSINGGSTWYRVFTGVLKLPNERSISTDEGGSVRLVARSTEERYLQLRYSSEQADVASRNADGYTEADYITDWLTAVGVSSGSMAIDSGQFLIPWGWLDDESPIDDCWSLAAAAGGRLYCDPEGVWRYENIAHWQVAARSLTAQLAVSRGSMDGFSLRIDDTDLYNVVVVEASPRSIGASDVIWEPDTTPIVDPAATRTITAKFDSPAYAITGIQFEAADDGGMSQTANVSVSGVYQAQRAVLTVVNSSQHRVHLYPLRIIGVPVIGGPEIEESRNSSDNGQNASFFSSRGSRTLSVRGNPYVQTQVHAASLAQFLLDRCEVPRLTAYADGCPGTPALRLGDRVTVTDAPTMSATFSGYVTAIRWWADESGFRQNLELVEASALYPYDGQYLILGSHSFYEMRRVFY